MKTRNQEVGVSGSMSRVSSHPGTLFTYSIKGFRVRTPSVQRQYELVGSCPHSLYTFALISTALPR